MDGGLPSPPVACCFCEGPDLAHPLQLFVAPGPLAAMQCLPVPVPHVTQARLRTFHSTSHYITFCYITFHTITLHFALYYVTLRSNYVAAVMLPQVTRQGFAHSFCSCTSGECIQLQIQVFHIQCRTLSAAALPVPDTPVHLLVLPGQGTPMLVGLQIQDLGTPSRYLATRFRI